MTQLLFNCPNTSLTELSFQNKALLNMRTIGCDCGEGALSWWAGELPGGAARGFNHLDYMFQVLTLWPPLFP